MNQPLKVSIIIPVYGVELYIEECLRSVMAQTYTNYECIIVDDCGQDKSIEIAENIISEYNGPATFRIVHRKKNGGLSAARNIGIHESIGDYLYFIDSDDKIFPDSISLLVTLAEKYPGVDMVQGNNESQSNEMMYLHYSDDKFSEYEIDRINIRKNILYNLPETAWNKLVRKDFIISHNLFFLEGIIHEDQMWKWDCQKHIKSMAVCNKNTYWYRTDNNSSIMANKDKTKSVICYLEIFKRMYENIEYKFELKYCVSFLHPFKKLLWWSNVRDKKRFKLKLHEAIETLNNYNDSDNSGVIILYIWYLPIYIINNRIFGKLYYLWLKNLYANNNFRSYK